MTPEDDVNKEAEQDAAENTEADLPQGEPKVGDLVEPHTEATDKAEDSSEPDDLDIAASVQSDDPLGFLDKNMNGAAPDELTSLKTQLIESEAQVASMKDQLLRIQAEMENQRKRAQNDVTKAHKFALEKFALDLLPVKDSLEMGLQAATAADAEPTKIIEGSELTLKMLAQALEKYNIVELNPVDEKFDPEFHQAMSMQPVEGKQPNTVASVMQKGYTLNERLIRPALVMVAK